jgi:putative ABC transport system permease protein
LALTALAVVLGIGSLVATVGFAQTGARQLEATFSVVDAVHGVVRPAEQQGGPGAGAAAVLPWDGDLSAARLNGVEAADLVSEVELEVPVITAAPVRRASNRWRGDTSTGGITHSTTAEVMHLLQ